MAEHLSPSPAPRSPDIAAAKEAIAARKTTWAKAKGTLADWLPINPETGRMKRADAQLKKLHPNK